MNGLLGSLKVSKLLSDKEACQRCSLTIKHRLQDRCWRTRCQAVWRREAASLPGSNDSQSSIHLGVGRGEKMLIPGPVQSSSNKPRSFCFQQATSALDTENERFVQQSLNRLAEGRSSLIIAHRLSTLYNTDKIIVLKDGQVSPQCRAMPGPCLHRTDLLSCVTGN